MNSIGAWLIGGAFLVSLTGSACLAATPPEDVPCAPQSSAFYRTVNRPQTPAGPLADYHSNSTSNRDEKPVLKEPVAEEPAPVKEGGASSALSGTD